MTPVDAASTVTHVLRAHADSDDGGEFLRLVEPGGAVALAAALTGKLPVRGRAVAVICSGGNVDHATFIRALSRHKPT